MNPLKLAWRNLFRNVRRTLASLFTVALGSGGLLIYQGFNTGIMNQYRENTIHGYYGYGEIYPENYYNIVKEMPWKFWLEDEVRIENELKKIPEIVELFPRVSLYAFLVKGDINLGGKGEGILAERENKFFNQMNFIAGNEIKNEDDIILGKGLAESLGAKIGDTVTVLVQTINGQLNGADYVVAGIFHMGKKIIDDTFFRVPLKSAQKLLNTNRVEKISLSTTGVTSWPTIEKKIRSANLGLDPIPFDVLDKSYYQNSVDFLEAQFSFVRMIILIIVALGIFNTIAVSLLERSGEIGALRANGESRSRLFQILFIENLILGCIGGIAGITLAVAFEKTLLSHGIPMPPGPGITRQFLIFLEIQPNHYLHALILPALTAGISSLWPISKIMKKSIPELLRST